MAGIDEIIAHLNALNEKAHEGVAAATEAIQRLQQAHGAFQDAFNHAASATGGSSSQTLLGVIHAIDTAKRAVEDAISAQASVPDSIAQAVTLANEYIERMQG